MYMTKSFTLSRDVEAVQIPSGQKMHLPAQTSGIITQSLGGTYTVTTEMGYMARIDGKDADALGLQPTAPSPAQQVKPPANEQEVKEAVWVQLKNVYDPEVPVNVVDLGLVYKCEVLRLADGRYAVEVHLTLTAPGCGMGDVLRQDAQNRVLTIPGVVEANVQLVLEPPWDRSMMSEGARLQLGMY